MRTFKVCTLLNNINDRCIFCITLIWAGLSIFIVSKGLSETDKHNCYLNTTRSDDECCRELNGRYLMVNGNKCIKYHSRNNCYS